MTPPLVLLPGMMCDARVWGPQIEDLARETPVTVAPINKGESIAEIAAALLPRLPSSFVVAGHGMGGIVAMEFLRTAPDRIEHLILMDTNCQAELPNVAAEREPQIVSAQCGRLDYVLQAAIKPDDFAPGAPRAELMGLMLDMGLHHGPATFIRQSRAMQRRPDQQGTLRRAKTPTSVVCGEYDPIYPLRRHEFIAHLMPKGQLHVIHDAGHLPMLEQPERVTGLLRDVLRLPYRL